MSLKHGFEVDVADDPAAVGKLRPSNWGSPDTDYDTDPTHVFTGGALGGLAMRDTDSVDGFSWLPSQEGVLVSDGDDEIPVFRPLLAADIPQLAYSSLSGLPTLGNSAALNVGTLAGTVAAGDHLHTGVYEPVFGTLGVAKGGTGLATLIAGDMVYASGPTTLAKLAAGAAGTVLTGGSTPAWSATPTLADLTLTGSLKRANGSAAAPSDAYAIDTDTGRYRIGADNEGFAAGGVLRWDYNTTRLLSTIPFQMAQSGELVPTTPIIVTPFSAGKQPFSIQLQSHQFNGVWDQYAMFGFNVDSYNGSIGAHNAEPYWVMAMENDYYDGVNHAMEWYLDYGSADGTTVVSFRPLYAQVIRNNNASHKAAVIVDVGDATGAFDILANAASAQSILTITSSLIQANRQVNFGQTGLQGTFRVYSNASSGTGAYGIFQADNSNLGRVTFSGGNGSAGAVNEFGFNSEVVPTTNNARSLGSANLRWANVYTNLIQSPTHYGGSAANDDLVLEGTSHATKATSYVTLQPTGGIVRIGTTAAVGGFYSDRTSLMLGQGLQFQVTDLGPNFGTGLAGIAYRDTAGETFGNPALVLRCNAYVFESETSTWMMHLTDTGQMGLGIGSLDGNARAQDLFHMRGGNIRVDHDPTAAVYATLVESSGNWVLGGSGVPMLGWGTSASFPAWKRSTTGLVARLANDSADTWLRASYFEGAGTVATAGDVRLKSAFSLQARNAANTFDAPILSTTSADATVLGAQTINVAQDATIAPLPAFTGTLTVINVTTERVGTFIVSATAGTVTEISDPAGEFTTVAGSSNQVNVYVTGGNLTIQNKKTGTNGFKVIVAK